MGTSPVERCRGRVVLIVTAHGDDCALFMGGTVRLLAEAGCDLHLARFTDDCTDSDGLDVVDTITRNRHELEDVARILGISTIHDQGYPSDTLGDVPRRELRERVIRLFRTVRPYAVLTIDPYSAYGEDNQDHIRLAQEVDEAFWTAMFDKHHPEHIAEGLAPHGVVERWYAGRRLTEVTDTIDIRTTVEAKVAAAVAHRTMMGNLMRQLRLMGQTAGVSPEALEQRLADQDGLVAAGVRRTTEESFRIVRYAGYHEFFDQMETSLS